MADAAKVTSNMIWRLMERFGAQGISFIISIVLARILDPSVYGIIALVTVFTEILNVFVDSGLGNALIQKKDADNLDFSTVFHFNMILSICLYIIMFILAPYIASFYQINELTLIIRVMSLSLIISGIKNIQIAYISRNMQFKKFFFATIGGTIVSAVVGITLAYKGYGVWALIIQNLCNSTIDTTILWITVQWHPRFQFNWQRLKSLLNFGWKLLASQLLDTGFKELRQLIIGKMYSKEDLAFYNKADLLPYLLTTNINSSIDSVIFPIMSSSQDNPTEVKAITKRTIKIGTYIIMPIMVGFAVCAEPLIRLILTDKWLPCIPYVRIFCFAYALFPIQTANLNALKALGRSDYFLQLDIFRKIVGLTFLITTMWFGVMAIAYNLLFTTIIYQIIDSWPNRKLLNYSYLEQLKDIMPQTLLSLLMGLIVYCVFLFHLSDICTLLIQVPLGVFIYIFTSKIFKVDSYEYTKIIMKQIVKKATKRQQ